MNRCKMLSIYLALNILLLNTVLVHGDNYYNYKLSSEIYETEPHENNEPWEDPFNMIGNVNIEDIIYSAPEEEKFAYSNESPSTKKKQLRSPKPETCSEKQDNFEIYMLRWFKMITSKFEEADSNTKGFFIPFDSEFITSLKGFSTTKPLKVSRFDKLMSDFIGIIAVVEKETIDWSSAGMYALIALCVGTVTAVFLYSFYYWTIHHQYLFLFFSIFSLSVAWHWMNLYQKQIAHQQYELSKQTLEECHKSDLNLYEHFYSYIKSYFVTNDCLKYYEAMYVNSIWEVSLTVAISETFASMLSQPLYSLSKALNAFFRNLFHELPLYVIIIVVVFLFLFLIFYFKYKIKLPFFLGGIEPCYKHNNYIEELSSNKKLESFAESIGKAITLPESFIPKQDVKKLTNNCEDISSPRSIRNCNCIKEKKIADTSN